MILHGNTPVEEVVLHCAAIRTGQFDGKSAFEVFATINRWHTERGFTNGFGYHALIMPDGEIYEGRPWTMIGAHVIGQNRGTLGVLLIEKRQVSRIATFEDYFTAAQRTALCSYLDRVPALKRVTGHNDYARKLCPGFRVSESGLWPPSARPANGGAGAVHTNLVHVCN